MLQGYSKSLIIRQFITIALTLVAIVLVLMFSHLSVHGNLSRTILVIPALVVGMIALAILSNWKHGFFLFLLWLTFEDLVRKYAGNNMIIFLAKDALVLVAYAAFFLAYQKRRVHLFHPPFLMSLLLVVWLGFMQIFNPASPSIFYGIVGFKLYFFYIPLMFLSYALIDSERTLQFFLAFNLGIVCIVAALGIIQGIVGPDFLNPQNLAPELEALNRLFRKAPEGGVAFHRPSGVFLSEGRFGWYITLMFIVSFGTTAYLTFAGRGWRLLIVPAMSLGLCIFALIISGSRGSFMLALISFVVLLPGTLWGSAWPRGILHRLLQRFVLLAVVAMIVIVVVSILYPAEVNARWQFYVQTLLPNTTHSTLVYRVWTYPMSQFYTNVSAPLASLGYGIGTASQALLYVPGIFGVPLPNTPRGAGESGFGIITLELGYLGLFFWLLWTVMLLYTGWRTVYRLRKTQLFPIGLALWWVAVEMLVFFTFGSIMGYQNFVNNAYLWVLVGVLFKLPELQPSAVNIENSAKKLIRIR